jgi:TM2 domain-containing membrane protein YozV
MCIKCGVGLGGLGSSGNPGQVSMGPVSGKKPVNAAILAILLGAFGAHKFYHGSNGWGVVYLLLCWTWISFLAGVVEGIIYLSMDSNEYDRKYNLEGKDPWKW